MLGIYFSGTGNTKYCIEKFVKAIDASTCCISIEEENVADKIQDTDTIILAYPIYFSSLPKIMQDFIVGNRRAFAGKSIFIIATMGLFSGDGSGCAARLLKSYGASVIGGLHLKMPDCIGDEKMLKKTPEQNKQLITAAEIKMMKAAHQFQHHAPTQEGIGFFYHVAGLFGQRLWFGNKTRNYSKQLKINPDHCVGCGTCESLCPMKNLHITNGIARAEGRCTMCYRCVNHCPKKAITLLGKKLYEQCRIEKYL